VAVVLTSFDRGGTERQMSELIRRLDPDRFEVHVVCFRLEGPWLARVSERAASVSEFRLGSFKSPRSLSQLIRLAAWFRERRVSVVHACDLYANIFALPAAAIARVGLRIGSRRGIVSPTSTRGLLMLQRLAYKAAHRVVANSEAAAAVLREEGVPGTRVLVIPNGIDMTTLPRVVRRVARRTVTTVANLRDGKGHDVLLDAAALVIRQRPDVSFLLVGDGPRRGALQAQAASHGLGDHVRFLGHRDDVGAILQGSDAFAFPSFMEAFPNSVMEAMAVGLPVVATRVGGIPELIDHEHNGLLVPARDADALATGVLRLLDDTAVANALGDAARRTIEERYSFDQMVRAFETLYRGADSSARTVPAVVCS
jgi:glycosyltransferase involved in cell wall biosynthesis